MATLKTRGEMRGKAQRAVIAAVLLIACGCEGKQLGARETGALAGAALGAGLGAIVGHQTGNAGPGVAIGSAFGALAGGLVGNEMDATQQQLDARNAKLDAQERQLQENRRLIEELRRRGADARGTERGVVVNLPDVLFDFDRATLTPAARATVREIADVVKNAATDRTVSVEGHTDSVGTFGYNTQLSEERARSVASELVANGVARRRLSTHGFGENRPIADNSTAAGRSKNRRVEVIVENR